MAPEERYKWMYHWLSCIIECPNTVSWENETRLLSTSSTVGKGRFPQLEFRAGRNFKRETPILKTLQCVVKLNAIDPRG